MQLAGVIERKVPYNKVILAEAAVPQEASSYQKH